MSCVRGLLAALEAAAATCDHREQEIEHVGGPVDDRGVHHLATAIATRAQDACEDANREIECAAADVADHGRRRLRRLASRTRIPQCAGKTRVVAVVARSLRHGAKLTPPGHPPIDEGWAAREANIRTKPEAFHNTRPHAFDQCVGALDKSQYDIDGFRLFEV